MADGVWNTQLNGNAKKISFLLLPLSNSANKLSSHFSISSDAVKTLSTNFPLVSHKLHIQDSG